MKSNWIGFLLVAAAFSWAVLAGGEPKLFWNIPSLGVVVAGVFGLLLFRFGSSGFADARSSTEVRARFCRFGSGVSITVGVLAAIVACVQMFTVIDSTNEIGRPLAVALLAPFYGCVLSLAFQIWEAGPSNAD